MHGPLILTLHHNLLRLHKLHTPPLTSFVLPPVQAANVHSNSNGDGAKDGEDDSEYDVADAVVGSGWAIDVAHPREEGVEIISW